MPLPPFSPLKSLAPENGREDRIQLQFGDWYMLAPKDHGLAKAQLSFLLAALISPAGKVFANQGTKKPLWVHNNKFTHDYDSENAAGRFLFQGCLKTNFITKTSDKPDCLSSLSGSLICFRFDPLYLNPLRFVRNQNLPENLADIKNPKKWGKAKWRINQPGKDQSGEFAYAGKTNWIPNNKLYDAFTGGKNWEHHLKRYVTKVRLVMEDAFKKALNLVASEYEDQVYKWHPIQYNEYYNLQEVETAWEFRHADPIDFVLTCRDTIFNIGHPAAESINYKLLRYHSKQERMRNSILVKISLKGGSKLRVYAKTNKRIRFEVITKKINRKGLLEEAGKWKEWSKNIKEVDEIPVLLKQISKEAAHSINTAVCPALAQLFNAKVRQRSVYTFLADFAKACENASEFGAVLAMLVNNGGIHMGAKGIPTPEKLIKAVQKLKRAKLLVHNPDTNINVVVPHYQWALKQLRFDNCAIYKQLKKWPPIRDR